MFKWNIGNTAVWTGMRWEVGNRSASRRHAAGFERGNAAAGPIVTDHVTYDTMI